MRKLLTMVLLCLTGLCGVRADEVSAPPAPPKDAMFTIYCRSFTSPDRVPESKRMRDGLIQTTGIKDFYLITSATEVSLYCGYYSAVAEDSTTNSDQREARRAHADVKIIKEVRDSDNNKPLALAMLVPIAQIGHEGPPAWDLLNTPKETCWTILIAVYRDNPERMKAAVDAVTQLRSDGIEAYYMHGSMSSIVSIGSWPKEAVDQQDFDEVRSVTPDEEIRTSPVPLDKLKPSAQDQFTPDGRIVRWVGPEKLAIRDAGLRRMMDQYPDFLINGRLMGKTVTDAKTNLKHFEGDRSVIYRVHRAETTILDGTTPSNPPSQNALEQLQPLTPAKTPGRKLKSLDD